MVRLQWSYPEDLALVASALKCRPVLGGNQVHATISPEIVPFEDEVDLGVARFRVLMVHLDLQRPTRQGVDDLLEVYENFVLRYC